MTNYNPYVQNLIEMGYDEQDCRNVAAVGNINVTYPRTIHCRTFETETEYNDAVADFINGLWLMETKLRIASSLLLCFAYFITLYVDTVSGSRLYLAGNSLALPYMIKHKCWDIVALLSFFIVVGLPKVFS